MNFARIQCITNPTPARRVTPTRNVYVAKFDLGREGYPVLQTGLPALAGYPANHVACENIRFSCGEQQGETDVFAGYQSCKRYQIKMRDYTDRRVTPPKRVTSPTWGPPPPCKQALKLISAQLQ